MEGIRTHRRPPESRRRRAASIAAGVFAAAGLALSASASGGLGSLAHAPNGSFCHVVRDCVYGEAPDTRIESGPLGVTDNPKPSFEFTSNEHHVTYQCRLDGHPFHTCQNPYRSEHLADGDHRIDVRAVDEHGNVDPSPASLEFRVDTRCPITEIADHPRGVVHGHHVSFRFASSDRKARFHSWLDGKRIKGQSGSHLKLGGLSSGRHVLSVSAVDAAGNSDSSPVRFKFRVAAKPHSHGHRHGHHEARVGTGAGISVAAPGGARHEATSARGAAWPLAAVAFAIAAAALDHGGFTSSSQTLFAGVAALALASGRSQRDEVSTIEAFGSEPVAAADRPGSAQRHQRRLDGGRSRRGASLERGALPASRRSSP